MLLILTKICSSPRFSCLHTSLHRHHTLQQARILFFPVIFILQNRYARAFWRLVQFSLQRDLVIILHARTILRVWNRTSVVAFLLSTLLEMEILNELSFNKSFLEPGSHYMKDNFWHSELLLGMEPQMGPTGGALTRLHPPHMSLTHDVVGCDIHNHPLSGKERTLAINCNSMTCNSPTTKLSTTEWVLSPNEASNGQNGFYLAGSYTSGSELTEDHMLRSSSSVQSFCDELVPSHHHNWEPTLSRTPSTLAFSNDSPSSEAVGSTEGGGQLDHLMEFMFEEDDPMGGAFGSIDTWFPEAMEFPFVHPPISQDVAYISSSGNSRGGLTEEGGVIQDKNERKMSSSFQAKHEVASHGKLGPVVPGPQLLSEANLWESSKKPNGLEEMFTPLPKRICGEAGRSEGVVPTLGSREQGGRKVGPNLETGWQGSFSVQHDLSIDGIASSITSSKSTHHHAKHTSLQSGVLGMANHLREDVINKSHDNIASQTPGPINFNGVQVHQDITREFGLNPILGSPLGAAKSETDYSEICLVHLLIAGAEAVATRDMDLASVVLVRLKELVSYSGSNMQRVAAYFSDGLQSRIEGKHLLDLVGCGKSHSDVLAAFQILHEISPYIKFGHFTANQAILEAVEGEKCVHIVDFEIMEGIQWPPLMQALVLRKGGPPQLRITALFRSHAECGLAIVQETGKRLTDFASSLNLPFSFHMVKVNNEEEFSVSSVKLIKGEALVVNCMLHLPHMPHRTATSVSSFLHGMRRLSPVVLTVVEEELGCSMMAVASYFFEALHHFSSICDSLEACLANETVARMLVERVFLAPRINSTVMFWSGASAHHQSELGTEYATYGWSSLVRQAGFKSLPLSFQNLAQARLLLGLYKDGFRLEERSNRLLLGWRTKPLFAASVWN